MPTFAFECKKCHEAYETLADFDPTGKYKEVACPACGGRRKTKLMTTPAGLVFANARESSKWDNFGYRAGKTMEEAKECRRAAEAASHVGADPYGRAAAAQIAADINNDTNYGKVK